MPDPIKGTVKAAISSKKNSPNISSINHKFYKEGKRVKIKHSINGDSVNGINLWYVLHNDTFIHAGSVEPDRDVKFISKEILLTADDLGVVEEIDRGAVDAINKGLINSIAVMVNQRTDDLDRPREIRRLLEELDDDGAIYRSSHIGLHFTVTSGKPLSDPANVSSLVNGDRFKLYGKYWGELDGRHINSEYVGHFKDELELQYQRFCDVFERPPDHLTTHHDTHTYSKELFEAFHEFAKTREPDRQIPVRSHVFVPWIRRFMFDVGGVSDVDILSVGRMKKLMERWNDRDYRSLTDYIDIRFYGPVGEINKRLEYTKAVNKKTKRFKEKILKRFLTSDSETMELLIHLIEHQGNKCFKGGFEESVYLKGYKGMKLKYFGGRCAEHEALRLIGSLKNRNEVEFMPRINN
ncbi:MAG: ChbG/HpnK family deacetylase [Bacteroidota bacterium]